MDNVTTTQVAAATTTAATATTGTLIFSAAMFVLSLIVSVAFGFFLLTEPSRLTEAWHAVRGLPLLVQLVLWALLLPWMIALWVWALPWALWLRLVLVIGILLWCNWLLFPWKG